MLTAIFLTPKLHKFGRCPLGFSERCNGYFLLQCCVFHHFLQLPVNQRGWSCLVQLEVVKGFLLIFLLSELVYLILKRILFSKMAPRNKSSKKSFHKFKKKNHVAKHDGESEKEDSDFEEAAAFQAKVSDALYYLSFATYKSCILSKYDSSDFCFTWLLYHLCNSC